eukprot:10263-Heterococcus_DN1.PRE.5
MKSVAICAEGLSNLACDPANHMRVLQSEGVLHQLLEALKVGRKSVTTAAADADAEAGEAATIYCKQCSMYSQTRCAAAAAAAAAAHRHGGPFDDCPILKLLLPSHFCCVILHSTAAADGFAEGDVPQTEPETEPATEPVKPADRKASASKLSSTGTDNSSSSSAAARSHVLRLLCSLASNPRALSAVADAGVVQTCWEVLCRQHKRENDALVCLCLRLYLQLLGNILYNTCDREFIRVDCKSEDAAASVALILYNMSCDAALAQRLVCGSSSSGSSSSSSSNQQQKAVGAATKASKAGVNSAGASGSSSSEDTLRTVKLLVYMVKTHKAPSVQGPCLGALQNLSAGAPNVPETAVGHQRLIEAGIMSALDAANTRSSGTTGTSSSSGSSGTGSGSSNSSSSSSKGTSLSCHCASILYNLSRNKKQARVITEDSFLGALMVLANCTDSTRVLCCSKRHVNQTLSHVSETAEVRSLVLITE